MSPKPPKPVLWILAGLAFAILWGSASTATKISLTAAQPLVIAETRFATAAFLMLFWVYIIKRKRLPKGKEWKQLVIYGFLNITLYLGLYVVAMQNVTAGVGALSVAINPILISFMSVFILGRKLTLSLILALVLGLSGTVIASWPLLADASITPLGLTLLFSGMVSYSVGAVYFASREWNGLSLLTINGWQTLFGGLLLFPVALYFYDPPANQLNMAFWGGTLWLAVMVSITAIFLWLWLLQQDTVKAGLWLFLCPLIGFTLAAVMVGDPISMYTVTGVLLVLLGLFISRFQKREV